MFFSSVVVGYVMFMTQLSISDAFSILPTTTTISFKYRSRLSLAGQDETSSINDILTDIGYTVTVDKPLGVIFGENNAPYYGLVIDDVEMGLNGGKAGMKSGDQLLLINDQNVLGSDFDSTMDQLRTVSSPIQLTLYRGKIDTLYTIVANKNDGKVITQQGEILDEDEIVFDESYESPVIMTAEDYEVNTISVSEMAGNAVKGLGNIFKGGEGDKKGLFGGMFSQETIQLEGDDASGTK